MGDKVGGGVKGASGDGDRHSGVDASKLFCAGEVGGSNSSVLLRLFKDRPSFLESNEASSRLSFGSMPTTAPS